MNSVVFLSRDITCKSPSENTFLKNVNGEDDDSDSSGLCETKSRTKKSAADETEKQAESESNFFYESSIYQHMLAKKKIRPLRKRAFQIKFVNNMNLFEGLPYVQYGSSMLQGI